MKKNLLLTSLASLFIITGCTSAPKKIVETEYVDYNKDVVVQELRMISNSIKESMIIMSRNDNAIKSEILTPEQIRLANFKATHVPVGMERKIPFKFKGPAVNALKALMRYVDYDIVVGGVKPVAMLEPIVFIDEKNARVIDLVQLIKTKTKGQLSINIREYADRKFLEVNYVR